MPISNQTVALSIIDFLKEAVASKQVSEDYAESMDVAIDCISDAFSVDGANASSTVASVFGGKLLSQILEAATSTTSPATDEAKTRPTNDSVSEKAKAEAEEMKLVGNRAMASRNFTEAIAKYTEAIALDPYNVIYYSNHAAAYTSNNESANAVADAQRAIELDPTSPKPYSRLGLAQFSLGEYENAMKLYEGPNKLDAMQRGYDTCKQRYEEQLEKSMGEGSLATQEKEIPKETNSAGGLPDFSSMFGKGGMPDLGSLMNNPQLMQAAQQMMSNPDALKNLMSNPALKQMAQNMGLGGEDGKGPDFSNLMNQFAGGKK